MREPVVRFEHRLGAPQVRVRGERGVTSLGGAHAERRHEGLQLVLDDADAAAQIQPQVERDLLVA